MTLKAQIMPYKVIYVALLFAGFAILMKNPTISEQSSSLLSADNIKSLASDKSLIFLALGIAVVVLDGIIPARFRDRLVHFRWNNPMPGSRAFSKIAPSDSRIDIKKLKASHGRFPKKPDDQNKLFYNLYQSVAKLPSIESGHKSYLLTRDLATMTYILVIPAVMMACYPVFDKSKVGIIVVSGISLAILFSIAAKNHSGRFVANVLAAASTGKKNESQSDKVA